MIKDEDRQGLLEANQNLVEELLNVKIDRKKPLNGTLKKKLYTLIVTRCKGTELEQASIDLYNAIIKALKESEM